MKIAILGCGTMGQMLARLLLKNQNPQLHLVMANRTVQTAREFCMVHPGVAVVADFGQAVEQADLVFLCVQPLACHALLESIGPRMPAGAHLVSILADVSLAALGSRWPGRISRLMPTITSEVAAGVSLIVHNPAVSSADQQTLATLFAGQLHLQTIDERQLNALSIVTSCGPGLLAALFQEFATAVESIVPVDPSLIATLLTQTLWASAETQLRQGLDFAALYAKVATPGGITEQGAGILKRQLPVVFSEMLQAMLTRHDQRSKEITEQFGLPEA